jgi:hypothetical protein
MSDNTGIVEVSPATYGATGASLNAFRRKYGPVQHTPVRMALGKSVGMDLFTPMKSQVKNSTSQFDLWTAGGKDFPGPNKVPKIRQETPAKSMYVYNDAIC